MNIYVFTMESGTPLSKVSCTQTIDNDIDGEQAIVKATMCETYHYVLVKSEIPWMNNVYFLGCLIWC